MLDHEVCVGNQALRGHKRSIADAALARRRLARVRQGAALVPGDPAGDAVKAVQRALIVLGFSTSTDGSALVDGDYGPGTERGVRQLQTELALAPTGIVGRSTLAALDEAVSACLATLDDDDRTRQRDILDRTVDMSPRELKARYRPAVQAAATGAGLREEVLAAITIVESGGGGNNRPKFEPHHFVALSDLRAAVDGKDAAGMDALTLETLLESIRKMRPRAAENGMRTSIGQTLLDEMAGSRQAAALRQAIAVVQAWTLRDLRELATSWGWGQIMGWHTVRKAFRAEGVTLAGLRSLKPQVQIATLGQAIHAEPAWRRAAEETNRTRDFAHFAAAYNGAPIGSLDNQTYACRMRDAAILYAQA